MITEDYVSFELAKMLKEKGFDEYCSHFYRLDGEHEYCCKAKLPRLTNNDIRNHDDWVNRVFACTCPTLQMAMKWLREIRKINIEIFTYWSIQEKAVYGNRIVSVEHANVFKEIDIAYDTYEEACEEAIKYCLENLI